MSQIQHENLLSIEKYLKCQPNILKEGKCPICLSIFNDPVMINPCFHAYCRTCIFGWAQNLILHDMKILTCPLCKSPFDEIMINIKSSTQYEVVKILGSSEEIVVLNLRKTIYNSHMKLIKVNGNSIKEDDPLKLYKSMEQLHEWMDRDLKALFGSDDHTIMIIKQLLLGAMKQAELNTREGFEKVRDVLQPFLFHNTTQFLQELLHFAASPLNIEAYDAVLEYCCQTPYQ